MERRKKRNITENGWKADGHYLPVIPGDRIWCIRTGSVEASTVQKVELTQKGLTIQASSDRAPAYGGMGIVDREYHGHDIGRTLFLSRAQAREWAGMTACERNIL